MNDRIQKPIDWPDHEQDPMPQLKIALASALTLAIVPRLALTGQAQNPTGPAVQWTAERSAKDQGSFIGLIGSDASAIYLLLHEGGSPNMDPYAERPTYI